MRIGDKLTVWLVSTNSGSKAHVKKDCSSLVNRATPPVEKEAVVTTVTDDGVAVTILKVGAYGVRRSYHNLCQRCS